MTTTNIDTDSIICRSLRHIDRLVAWWVMRLQDDYNRNPGTIPHYTTWAGLEAVISKVEAAGYWVSMEGACGLGMNPDEPDAALHPRGSTEESGYATGPSIPVALCLAALAAFGCRVQLELD